MKLLLLSLLLLLLVVFNFWLFFKKSQLARGLKIEGQDSHGFTALCWAARHGAVSAIELLLERGASIETVTHAGQTPAILAALFGQTEALQVSGSAVAAIAATNPALGAHRLCNMVVPISITPTFLAGPLCTGERSWSASESAQQADQRRRAAVEGNLEAVHFLIAAGVSQKVLSL